MKNLDISVNGLSFIATYEGFSPKATKCLKTEKYYTIGYGHYGKDVKPTDTITQEKAVELLKKDIQPIVQSVNKLNELGLYNLTQPQFDAFVSFAYNCGYGNLLKLTDNGKRSMRVITDKITSYNKSGGKEIKGLTNRRLDERELLVYSDYVRNH